MGMEEQPIVVHPPPTEGGAGAAEGPAAGGGSDAEGTRGAERPARERADVPPVGPSAGGTAVAAPGTPAAGPARRAQSLDALRGLFLILMTLGFTIQAGVFPDWMYHRQTPPSGEVLDIPGIAWRDLAYAAFIFTMAAAFPITLSRRIERGETELGILGAVLRRGFLLFVFALLIGHSNTYFIGYTQQGRVVAIVGFLIMFMVFTRRRSDWNESRHTTIRRIGWVAAVAFLALSPLVYDEVFSPARRDQVIAELTFAAVVGSTVWYFTRHNMTARVVVLAGALALYLGAQGEGWISRHWWSSPAPWLFTPSWLSLLAVIVPGTIAGDHIVRWMRAADVDSALPRRWHAGRLLLLAVLGLVFTPLVVLGLYNRWVAGTTQLTAALVMAGLFLVHRPLHSGERLLRGLFIPAAVWLMLGLLLEPFENGIRKVPETLSYFFTVSGLTTMLLVSLVAVIDLMRRERWARPLIEVGQNPMLCYVLFTVFLNSLFELLPPLRTLLRTSPALSITRSILTTVLVVVIVQWFTRRRIYWRT